MTAERMCQLMLRWINQRVEWLEATIPDGAYLQGQVAAYLQVCGLLQFMAEERPRRSGRTLSCAPPERGTGGGQPPPAAAAAETPQPPVM